MNNSINLVESTISVLQNMAQSERYESVRAELEFALQEVKKCVPAKPVRESWCPNLCPTCGEDLGGFCDDGYYDNPYYEFCPTCRQVLDYD